MSKWTVQWQGNNRTCTRTLRTGAWDRLWRAKLAIAARDWPGQGYLARVFYARMRDAGGAMYQVQISLDGYRQIPCTSWTPKGQIVHVIDPQ